MLICSLSNYQSSDTVDNVSKLTINIAPNCHIYIKCVITTFGLVIVIQFCKRLKK